MTYRERVAIEYPDKINPYCDGGVVGCPGSYWDGATYIQPLRCGVSNDVCTACWDQKAPPRKVKVRRIMKTYHGDEEIIESTTQMPTVRVYQEIETIENCTVQILKDPVTGEESVGWFRGQMEDG